MTTMWGRGGPGAGSFGGGRSDFLPEGQPPVPGKQVSVAVRPRAHLALWLA